MENSQRDRLDMNRLQPLRGQEILFIGGPQTYKITNDEQTQRKSVELHQPSPVGPPDARSTRRQRVHAPVRRRKAAK